MSKVPPCCTGAVFLALNCGSDSEVQLLEVHYGIAACYWHVEFPDACWMPSFERFPLEFPPDLYQYGCLHV
jgi:hypothetical protein